MDDRTSQSLDEFFIEGFLVNIISGVVRLIHILAERTAVALTVADPE